MGLSLLLILSPPMESSYGYHDAMFDSHNSGLSHVDDDGHIRMVDVSNKDITPRRARAMSRVQMSPETLTLALSQKGPKGEVFEVARIAGILAAKQTSQLIPLCHPLPLDHVDVQLKPCVAGESLEIMATATTSSRTGVEMEALTAAAVAALTVIDMLKAVDKNMTVTDLQVMEKAGGRSGDWSREEDA